MLFAANNQQNSNGGQEIMQIEPNDVVCDSNSVNITIIYDNNTFKQPLETAWGFSCLITGVGKTILFDTGGDGAILLGNMTKLGIEPNCVDLVVLSHEHWDHVGGMEMFLAENHDVNTYVPVSFTKDFKEMVNSSGAKVIEVSKPDQVCRGVYSTGQMGTSIKEQGLIIRTDKGLILITGCAHPGIVEMTQRTKEIFNEPVLFVMGGFHLSSASNRRIEEIIEAFESFEVGHAAPCHCSGDNTRALFAQNFGEKYVELGVGRVISVKDLK